MGRERRGNGWRHACSKPTKQMASLPPTHQTPPIPCIFLILPCRGLFEIETSVVKSTTVGPGYKVAVYEVKSVIK